MKVRHKIKGYTGSASQFNTHGLGEMIVCFDGDGGMDSEFIKDYEAFITATGEWKDMSEAFRDRDIINDNYNTYFFEPPTPEDRERGFTL